MKEFLPIIQIIVAVCLIAGVLLQRRGQGLGSTFGGESSFYATRRGIQGKIFWATVVLGAIFILLALLNLTL